MEVENRKVMVGYFTRLQRQVEAWDAASVQGGTHFVKMNNLLATLHLLQPAKAHDVRFSSEIEATFPDLRDRLMDRHRALVEDHLKGIHVSMYTRIYLFS
jgi:hypothetical protein